VQLSTPTSTFLVDVLDKGPDDKLVGWLRTLLEDESVTKVIHDCRMDSDALYHHLKISLVNAHDTSCWHAANGFVDKNLNETLQFHRLSPNVVRDGSVYKTNPAFWATRPLTQKMISWAAGDVQCMFDLYKCQAWQ
jgi:exonuclease 3'-5' domain-containing protein 1